VAVHFTLSHELTYDEATLGISCFQAIRRRFPARSSGGCFEGSSMTLIAGFRLHRGGILLCADREQLTGAGKHTVDKIDRFSLAASSYVIAATGSHPILANALPRIRQCLQDAEKNGKDLRMEHQAIIGSALRPLHEEMVWGRTDENERGISLIVAASFGQQKGEMTTALYGNYGDTLYPANAYLCEGTGRDLAYYLTDKLYSGVYFSLPNRTKAIVQAAFIFRGVREAVPGVGLETDMVLLSGTERGVRIIPYSVIEKLDQELSEIQAGIQKAWNQGLKIPDWLKQESADSDIENLPEIYI
jgi:hypothetical protein